MTTVHLKGLSQREIRRAQRVMRRRTRRVAVRSSGELLITLGTVLLLFCVYQLYWTNLATKREQSALRNNLTRTWDRSGGLPNAVSQLPKASPSPNGVASPSPLPSPEPSQARRTPLRNGDGFAIVHIPRLGEGWARVVVEGVELDDLKKGPGHYPESAHPGEVGNVAIAGHRATNGEPFRNLDLLQPGDVVILETKDMYYTYVVDWYEIVDPTDVGVVLPVPRRPGAEPAEKLLTLTTCHPRWASTHRLIVFGHQESEYVK